MSIQQYNLSGAVSAGVNQYMGQGPSLNGKTLNIVANDVADAHANGRIRRRVGQGSDGRRMRSIDA